MSSDRLHILCLHNEILPSGALAPAPHVLQGEWQASQQQLWVCGVPVLTAGDTCDNESADHRSPRLGTAFLSAPASRAEVVTAGQAIVFLNGRAVATLGGVIRCCSESQPEQPARQSVCPGSRPLVFIAGQAVLCGRAS
jgi:uncharacterized Zn-binding protein involved in type VI secretion